MNSPQDISPELVRYFDHALSEEETRSLEARLIQDAGLRAEFREYASQAMAMGDLGRVKGWHQTEQEHTPSHSGPVLKPIGSGILAWAAAIALITGAVLWHRGHQEVPSMATVEYVEGSVRWNDASGQLTDQVTPSTLVGAGTLTVESASGSAQIRFTDGTTLTFLGESEAHLSEMEGRKRILLDRGQLTASVTPQPDHQPLTVITPTAEIEMRSTRLAVTADDSETALTVNSGHVALKRLADGETVEVPPGQSVLATLNARAPLIPAPSMELPGHWKLDRQHRDWIRITKGREISVQGIECLDAEFYVAGRDEQGNKIIRRGISINGPIVQGDSLVQLGLHSLLRLRYKTESSLSIFLSTKLSGGGFGGNFEHRIEPHEVAPDAAGWRELLVPMTDFHRLAPYRSTGESPPLYVNRLSKILVSVGPKSSLQLAEAEILAGPSRSL